MADAMKATLQTVMDMHENIDVSRPIATEKDRAAYVSESAAILLVCGWTADEYLYALCDRIEEKRVEVAE